MKQNMRKLTVAASTFVVAALFSFGWISTRPHYAVTAYYAGGPWYGYSGWDDYASRNGIKCTPGATVTLDDGQIYVCQ